MNEVVTLISTVGFPAAMCLILMYYMFKREEEHSKEMKEFQKAINNNTAAITKLVSKLEGK